ncbi:hypothetical protein MTR67_048474 [Solanum verrucosum]|uniref:Uncharacterized protein n=1 Tax=Solanum verrucosum TaxID=315347 RepID=A0AAF0V0P2_SOLVR|nr:hypothetical protein MTR67_048474 [Solanum verrucosum]
MLNYGREQLNRFSTTIYRTQYSKLNNFRTQVLNDTTHLKNARLIEFMQNYGHEQLNLRTFEYNLKRIRNSILKNLEHEDTTPLKDTQIMDFMGNLWASTTRLKGLNNNIELMCTTLLILILTSSKLSSNR